MGHGDSFWSVALAVGAYQDFYAPDRGKGVVYLGDIQETLTEKKLDSRIREDICKICNKRTLEIRENGEVFCTTCLATTRIVPSNIGGMEKWISKQLSQKGLDVNTMH